MPSPVTYSLIYLWKVPNCVFDHSTNFHSYISPKADLMNALNSYVSTNNISPPEKQVITGTAYNCPEGHTLAYSESQLSKFRCDLCRSERDKGRYSCKSCNYDVCTTCRAPPPGSSPAPAVKTEPKKVEPPPTKYEPVSTSHDKCKRGHNLVLKTTTQKVNRILYCEIGRASCRERGSSPV